MSDRSFTQRQRDLLRHLTSLVAERARAEATLDERNQSVSARVTRQYDEAVASAAADLARRQAESAAELKREQDVNRPRFESQLAAARKRMDTHLRNQSAKTVAIGKVATQELEEAQWLAETLVESGGLKIRADFELARKGIERRITEVASLRNQADSLLETYRHPPLSAQSPSAGDEPGGTARLDELAAELNKAITDGHAKLQALDRRVRPVPLRLWAVITAAVIVGGAAGFAYASWGDNPPPENIGGAALAGALAAAAVMFFLRRLARRRVPEAARAMADALQEAGSLGRRCLRRAEADRDQQTVELIAKRDEEVSKAEKRFAAVRREVGRRMQVDGPRLRDRHARRLSRIRERYDAAMAAIEAAHRQRTEQAQADHDSSVAAATAQRDEELRQLAESDRAQRDSVRTTWLRGAASIHAELDSMAADLAQAVRPWTDPAWSQLVPAATTPDAVPFGHLDIDMAVLPGGLSPDPSMAPASPTAFALPAVLDILDRGSLLINAGPEGSGRAVDLLKNVMLRLLTAFPPGKVRFTIIDPVGMGQNFAGFMHLADFDEALVGGKIWSEPRHIEQRLTDLTEHMETVIQKYLRNEFASIQEYNERAGEVAEPYRFLVIADFPANMTEAASKRLASIASSGARCGLYTLIATAAPIGRDGRPRIPHWAPLSALEASSIVLAWNGARFLWQNDDFSAWPLTIEPAPAEEQITSLVHQVGRLAKDASRVQVPFEAVAPPQPQLWSLDASDEVRVPLGRAGAKNLQYFTLGRGTAQHALIAGRTGSGKSTLLHVLITNLALWYSPDEVELYLVDFKKGVEFKTYATHELPHARVIAVESEREFGLSVLRRLDAELTRRGQLFREAGAQDVAGYRRIMAARERESGGAAVASAAVSRILLIVDEFQEFFVEDDKLAQEASLLLDRLVRQGRAFGMHIVLGSQTLGGAYSIARSTIGQMAVRIALQCSEADSYLIMAEDNAAARLLSRPGEAIYNDVSGRIEGNSPFQIVWLPEEKREVFLRRMRERLDSNGKGPPAAIVFEGNIPADIARNHLLASLIDRRTPPPPAPRAWLGEPISIKEPTAATFRRQSGSNLLIVGQQEDTALAMALSTVLSLAAQLPPSDPNLPAILALDATPADSPHAGRLDSLASKLPSLVRLARVRDAAAAIAALSEELARREGLDQPAPQPLFLMVLGLQRFRDLRKEDEFSFSGRDDEAQTPAQQFTRLLREGPVHGIHSIVWCDTVTNVERSLDRNSLREFESRVLFQMSAADSTHLIDTPAAATLGRYRALLHSEESGVLEKFRPYAMPEGPWLDAAAARLARRS